MEKSQTVSTAEMASNAGDMTKVLQDLQGRIHFVIKKLKPSHVPEDTISDKCTMMIPVRFVKEHSDKFQRSVVLRSSLSPEPSTVGLSICNKLPSPEIKFGKGWKAFATRNELMVGDSLIFELKGVSEFEVYVFRGTPGNVPTSASSSHAPKKRFTGSEISQKNGNHDSSAGSHQHLASERSEGSVDDLSGWIAKKRKVGDEGEVSASQTTMMQNSISCMNLHHVELENVQMSSIEKRHNSQSNQELPGDDIKEFKMPVTGDESENPSARKVHVKEEFEQSKTALPSFIQRLAVHNVQDSAGNTCGACIEIPLSFVNTHITRLQHDHVKLQGIREESPIRTVTCSIYKMQQECEEGSTRQLLWLGWGDFVRENALRAGQELVFTLAAESFFVVREASETDIEYTK